MDIKESTKEDLLNEIAALKNENLNLKASFKKYKTWTERAEDKFKMLFELSPIGMALVDHETGDFLEVNSSILQATQYTKDEFLNLSYWDITPRQYEEQEIQQVKDLNETGCFGPNEKEYIRKDGSRYPLSISGASFTDTTGKQVVWGIIEDISARKQSEEIIKQKNKELTKLNVEKDKFFSVISHDLRAPFNGFLGLTELLSTSFSTMSKDESQDLLVRLNNSASDLYKLIENLLEWARIQEGRMSFMPEKLNIYDLIQDVLNVEREVVNKKGIHIDCHLSESLRSVVDQYMFQSVIRNLLSNAIKFTPHKGEIEISGEFVEDQLMISIRDSGIGMNNDLINKLFRLGENTSRTGTDGEPSTGLGLFLCKGFVEKHKGKLWVESEEGKGSVFHFTLPKK